MKRPALAAVLTMTMCVAAAAKVAPAAPAAPPVLVNAIIGFADFKTFRATDAELDAVFSPHCRKERSIKDDEGVFYEYACNGASGLKSAQLTVRKIGKAPPFLTLLHVVYSSDYYEELRKKVGEKLGKPMATQKDRTTWEHPKDKKRNENGTPTISMFRDRDEKLTSFDVSLEQGL